MRLLIADPKWSWRERLKETTKGRDLLCLDVGDADFGPPGRVFLLREGKVRAWRLVGSVHPNRNPVDLIVGALDLARQASEEADVLSFAMRANPVLRQAITALAEAIKPSEVLLPEGSEFVHEPWPTKTETVKLELALPENAKTAQRRARWLEMLESCSEHEVELDHVALLGVRLGSGTRLTKPPFDRLGVHVEVYGSTLLVVADHDIEETLAAEALNISHATHINVVSTSAYDGLLCSFVRGSGEDFGIGVVKSLDFENRRATFLNTAVPPAPLRAVRIGSLRIDVTGKETGETKPWAV